MANNEEFEEWSKLPAGSDENTETDSVLVWTASVEEAFAEELRTEEAVDHAVTTLYWWRANYGLETDPLVCEERRRLQSAIN